MSTAMEFECRRAVVVTARRVPTGAEAFVSTHYGVFVVPAGDWIVRYGASGVEWPMKHEAMKQVFQPRDESLRRRWNDS